MILAHFLLFYEMLLTTALEHDDALDISHELSVDYTLVTKTPKVEV